LAQVPVSAGYFKRIRERSGARATSQALVFVDSGNDHQSMVLRYL